MAVTENAYTGNGSTTNYSFTFPYLKSTDIEVQVDAVVTTAWSLANATTIQFNSAPANGAAIKILRTTNVDNLTATFYAGSAIKSEDLNDNFTQNLYVTQEVGNRSFQNTGTSTMIGNLKMGEDTTIVFEGATDNAHETTVTVTDPTADRTITLPNVTGTVVTTGDTGTVAAGMIASNAVTTAKINNDAVTTDKLANSINTAIDANTAKVTNATHTGDVTGATSLTIAAGAVTTAKLAADAVDGTKLADDSVDSEHYVDGSIDTAHLAADAVDGTKIADNAIGAEHIAANAVTTSEIADAELTTLASMQSGTASILAGGTALAATLTEINTVCDGKGVHTTISDSDAHYPTSGAVVDYVSTQLATVGGFETIATDAAFPNTQPASGIIVSIADAGGLVVNGSGVSTTGRTVGASTVTINGINSQFYSTTVANGVAMMVESTGSGHIYNYHKATLKEADLINLSSDIDDFGNRYRVASSAPGSNNDEGDLYFDTTANKMYVYDGSAWGQVTSTGDFKFLFLCPTGGTGAPTINGSVATYDLREGSNSGTAASVTNAAQLTVSINGVVQKPNTGTSAPSEGFALVDANTIIFGSNLPASAEVFIIQSGSALTINTVGDNTIATAKIQNSAVTTDKLGTSAVTGAKIADDTITEAKLDIHAAPSGTDKFLKYTSNGMEWVVPSYTTNTNTNVLAGGTITGDVVFDNATNAGNDLTWDMSDNALEFDDNVKATFGDGADIQIYHNATNSFIKNSTGHFKICGDSLSFRNAADGEDLALFTADGACKLGYDNSFELETKSGGVKLNGHSESVITALTSASSVTIDFSLSNHFSCTMGHNITFANPTTESVGQSGTIVLTQDGTGSRTASWGSQFLWAGGTAPTLSTAATAVDRIDYFVAAADKIHCVASLAMA